jgi:metal-responsive CopG/Arc/MetJ family transcriptional regulator
MIGARFPAALTEAIDKWAASNGDIGRSEAMRRLVELGLKAKGKGAIGGRGRS